MIYFGLYPSIARRGLLFPFSCYSTFFDVLAIPVDSSPFGAQTVKVPLFSHVDFISNGDPVSTVLGWLPSNVVPCLIIT